MKSTDEMTKESNALMAEAGVPNEEAMRDAKPPNPKTIEELCEAIQSLVERPHSYGTCVYALSHAALAAFNFVASKLGVTGFQASCADMNILKHTRNWKWGCILDYENLLHPQYRDHFKTFDQLIDEHQEELGKRARELLAKNPEAHGAVSDHWRRLAKHTPSPVTPKEQE